MEFHNLINLCTDYKSIILRSEDKISTDKEIDMLMLDEDCFNVYLKEVFMNGLLIDQRKENYPHVKLKYFDKYSVVRELDVLRDVYFFKKSRHFKLLKENVVLESKTIIHKKYNFNILNLEDKYITLLLHAFTDKKRISKKYDEKLLELKHKIDNKLLLNRIKDYKINYFLFSQIEKSFLTKKKVYLLRNLLFIFSAVSQPNIFFKATVKQFQRFLSSLKRRVFKFKVLVFMGVDGSGKTTTIDCLIDMLGEENCYYVHLGNKSNLLPTTRIINHIRNKNSSNKEKIDFNLEGSNKEKRESTSKNKIIAILFNVNFFIEVYINIIWVLFKNTLFLKKKFILIDRYIYDRYYHNESMFKYNFFPSPDLIFLLDASLETLLERKQEHDKDVLSSFQLRYYEFLLKQNKSKVIRINTENQINKTLNQIKTIIDEHS